MVTFIFTVLMLLPPGGEQVLHQTIQPLESGFHQTLLSKHSLLGDATAYLKLANITDIEDQHAVHELLGYWSAKMNHTCSQHPTSAVCETSFLDLVTYAIWIVEHSKIVTVKVGWREHHTTVDPLIVAAIIWHESKILAHAVGPNGRDSGLMQVCDKYTPYTSQELLDPETNIKVGIGSLGFWKTRPKFKKDWLAHYADGVYLGVRGLGFQMWVHKQVNQWRLAQETGTYGDPAG